MATLSLLCRQFEMFILVSFLLQGVFIKCFSIYNCIRLFHLIGMPFLSGQILLRILESKSIQLGVQRSNIYQNSVLVQVVNLRTVFSYLHEEIKLHYILKFLIINVIYFIHIYILYFQSTFRFTTKVSKNYRDFPCIFCPHVHTACLFYFIKH